MAKPISFITGLQKDFKEDIVYKPIGLIIKNKDIRNEILSKNIGKYPMSEKYPSNIGKAPDVYSNSLNKPTQMNKNGIVDKTHGKNEFGESINRKYGFSEDIMEYYTSKPIPSLIKKWLGNFDKDKNSRLDKNYSNYIDYINYVFGSKVTLNNYLSELFKVDKISDAMGKDFNPENILTVREVLNNFLSYGDLKSAMENTNVGVVRNIDVIGSLNGLVKTNINNYSSTDTRLGLITNVMYSNLLRDAAQFNSLRGAKSITPELRGIYGNNLSNLSNLPFLTTINELTGRIENEVGNGYGTRHIHDDVHGSEFNTMSDFADSNLYPKYKEMFDSSTARYGNILRNHEKGYNTPFRQYTDEDKSFDMVGGYVDSSLVSKFYKMWADKPLGMSYIEKEIDGDTFVSSPNLIEKDGSLVSKTSSLFQRKDSNGIDTLIGSFHTRGFKDITHNQASTTQSAVSKFGMSHGRNLLSRKSYKTQEPNYVNGYENPYDRVWTYHKPFHKVSDLMKSNIDDIGFQQKEWTKFSRTYRGANHLGENTSINKNGFVNITPTAEGESSVDIKNCMFSIENLAWKDVKKTENVVRVVDGKKITESTPVLSSEQIGPMGGRIMWFPPYNLKFNEQISVGWNQNDFIGRGEKMYSYTNTDRQGTLSFSLLIDYPSIVDYWKNGKGKSTEKTEDLEQELLRFFAGCDTLYVDNEKKDIVENKPIERKKFNFYLPDTKPKKRIVFYVFFPNYYSGISVVNSKSEELDDFAMRYGNGNKENIAARYLYCGTDYYVTDEIGNGYEMGDAPLTTLTLSETEKGYHGQGWLYAVDDFILNQNKRLRYKSNYSDSKSFKLNSDLSSVKKDINFSDATHTFKDIYEDIDTVIGKDYEIKGAFIQGFANSQGDFPNNKKLATYRSQFVQKWIIKNTTVTSDKFFVKEPSVIDVSVLDKNTVSGESAKRARSVKVILECELKAKAYTEVGQKIDNESYRNDEKDEIRLRRRNERASKRAEKKRMKDLKKKMKDEEFLKTISRLAKDNESNFFKKVLEDSKESNHIIENLNWTSADEILMEKRNTIRTRYDNEAEFFKMLKENDPFIHKKIVDKIKYFDPAYHSITPEGFNARLTFLQQCTRQGHTIGASDGTWSSKSAGNLAFGKPPVCVLRLGDFYHTKILINSLNIEYDPLLWDMNPEGIGMQPMIANITMSFVFLGGSDLEAPISRLQNAVSFNYYANSSVYDNRADMAKYIGLDNVVDGGSWVPERNDGNENKEDK